VLFRSPGKFDHIFRKTPREKLRRISTDLFRAGWTEIYDENIADREDFLKETALGVFNQVCRDGFIQQEVLIRIIEHIQPLYRPNYYHSFEHAVHVLINCGYFLIRVSDTFDFVEKLALLYAALIHDVEHLGVPNMTLVKKRHPFARLYNDQSVAENHSLALGLELIERPGFDLLESFTEEEKLKFHEIVVEVVLCTDVADMYKKHLAYLKIKDFSNEETGKLNVSEQAGRIGLLMLILRICDIGSSMQSLRTSHSWVRKYFLEIRLAALCGDGPNFNLSGFYDSQIKYIVGHSQSLIERLRKTQAIDEEFVNLLATNCADNLEDWGVNGMEMLELWEQDPIVTSFASSYSLLGSIQEEENGTVVQKEEAVGQEEEEEDLDSSVIISMPTK
jgi:hypothetical protein